VSHANHLVTPREARKRGSEVIIDRQTTALVVDSTADLPDNLLNDPNVTMVPLTVFFDGQGYLDWAELKPAEFYEKLKTASTLPTTSQPSPGTWLETYQLLRERYERVYSIHMSSLLGGSYATACVAAGQIDNVTVVDSTVVCGGMSLLVDRLVDRLERGTPQEEFEAFIAHYVAHKTFFFLLTTLEYNYRGGRLGAASYLVGNAFNIRPALAMDDGKVRVYRKSRGVRGAMNALRDGFLERTKPGLQTYVNLSHGLNLEGMAQLQELILATDRTIELRPPSIVGSVIGTHAGPGALGLSFIQE
jgi:DegV family protein with EDD domain